MFSITSRPSKKQLHSVSSQNFGLLGFASTGELLDSAPNGGTMRAAIYARVSTPDQKCEMQLTNCGNTYYAGHGNRQQNFGPGGIGAWPSQRQLAQKKY